MNPDLERLIQLQRVGERAEAGAGRPGRDPRAAGGVGGGAGRGARPPRRRPRLARRDRRRRAAATRATLQDLEAKRSKYKGQLMEVKTNKEYTAMLHEIEAVEREIRGREDQILAEMEKAESLTAEVKSEEAAFKAARSAPPARTCAPSTSARARWRPRRHAWPSSATQVAGTSADDALELFQRVAQLRGVGRGGGPRRHVPGLPREAAPADVRRTSSATKRSCSARLQPHPLLRAARPRRAPQP